MVLLWFLCSAFPIGVIATFVVLRSNGWLIQKSASLDVPVLVVSLAAVILGLPVMMLTSRSIADPVGEVVDAMAEVEHGRIGTAVGVYERSQIGRLQTGFNRMVAGLAERDRLRDLFTVEVYSRQRWTQKIDCFFFYGRPTFLRFARRPSIANGPEPPKTRAARHAR